jgi:hypothetical protein
VHRPRLIVTFLMIVGSVLLSSHLDAAVVTVVIGEIHYHPPEPDGDRLEFVELWNSGPAEVELDGWRLLGGIRFTFPANTTIAAGGRLVVARDRLALVPNGDDPAVIGNFSGSLANEGEELMLVDAGNARADAVPYDDQVPWADADGQGFSLQRLCADERSENPSNWDAAAPTPGSGFVRETCNIPLPPVPSVVISEIFYHPPLEVHGRPVGIDEAAEFVELHNLSGQAVNVGGWEFIDGIEFTIPGGVSIPSGGSLVVARDPDLMVRKYESVTSENVVGPFVGKLSNVGERITLVAGAEIIDSVHYRDSVDWPYSPDGEGRSLEKVFLDGTSWDPANWTGSQIVPDTFFRFEVEGPPGPFADADFSEPGMQATFVIALDGFGEALIDNIILVDVNAPSVNLLSNGDFEDGLDNWRTEGNARPSLWENTSGVNGSGGLTLSTDGPCPFEGCDDCRQPIPGFTNFETCQGGRYFNGLVQIIPDGLLDASKTYRIAIEARSVNGSFNVRAGFGVGTQVRVCLASPGAPNSIEKSAPLPVVTGVGRWPREPRSTDETTITAVVRSENDPVVRLLFGASDQGDSVVIDQEIILLDDGAHGDRLPGDGVFGGTLPMFPHNHQVRFRILVEEGGVVRHISPRPIDDSNVLEHEVRGYYVNDNQPDSILPVQHILIDGVPGEFRRVGAELSCTTLSRASMAFEGELYPDIGLRFRGNTACLVNKRNFKLRFNRGRFFTGTGPGRNSQPLKKLNLNGLWTDKAIVREKIAWDFVEELGAPALDTHYVRVHVSGDYYGLFINIEHPDSCFLARNGLDPDGSLYKANQPPQDAIFTEPGVRLVSPGAYPLAFEEETNRGTDFADIATFVNRMHNDSFVGPTRAFWQENGLADTILRFQLSNVLLQNRDSAKKNHFLYHDLVSDRWGIVNWDLDLSFGKFFTTSAVQRDPIDLFAGRQVGTLNDILRSEIQAFLDPWVMTSLGANAPQDGNAMVDFFFTAEGGFYQRAYIVRLWDLLREKYRNDVLDPIIDELVELLRDEIDQDFLFWDRYPTNAIRPDFNDDPYFNIAAMKEEISLIREFLIDYFEKNHTSFLDEPRLKITEILYYPLGGDERLQYVELLNTTGREIDVSGWTIEGISFEFPFGSLIGAEEVIVLARDAALLEAAHPDRSFDRLFVFNAPLASGGEVLRVRDSGPGEIGPGETFPATVEYLKYGVGGSWPSARPGHSIELMAVTATRDNDRGTAWRHSLEPGGTPGSAAISFLRGDANGDGGADISDPLVMLRHMFLGEPVSCADAVDADDSGVADITDPLHLLKFLFLGAAPPPSPFPTAGADLTPDTLGCDLPE